MVPTIVKHTFSIGLGILVGWKNLCHHRARKDHKCNSKVLEIDASETLMALSKIQFSYLFFGGRHRWCTTLYTQNDFNHRINHVALSLSTVLFYSPLPPPPSTLSYLCPAYPHNLLDNRTCLSYYDSNG